MTSSDIGGRPFRVLLPGLGVKLVLLLVAGLAAAGESQPITPKAIPDGRKDRASAGARPRLAVVIDDFGLTYPKNVPDVKWMEIPWPITFAVMPESPRTRQAAEATINADKELILHFPFDPFLDLKLPSDRFDDQDLEKVKALLEKSLRQVKNPVGLNNHRSYKATRNRPLMAAFMKLMRGRGLYFLDSKVSAKSVAAEEARRAGLKAAANDVFLDEAKRHDKSFCISMLRRAAALARRRGWAIAIGHHYFHGTYECLVEEVPKLQAQGIEFVHASALAE